MYVSKDYIELEEGMISSFMSGFKGRNSANVTIIVRKDLPRKKQLENIKKRKEGIRRYLAKKGVKLGNAKIVYARDDKHKREIIKKLKGKK